MVFDPESVVVTVGGQPILGFLEADKVTYNPDDLLRLPYEMGGGPIAGHFEWKCEVVLSVREAQRAHDRIERVFWNAGSYWWKRLMRYRSRLRRRGIVNVHGPRARAAFGLLSTDPVTWQKRTS